MCLIFYKYFIIVNLIFFYSTYIIYEYYFYFCNNVLLKTGFLLYKKNYLYIATLYLYCKKITDFERK